MDLLGLVDSEHVRVRLAATPVSVSVARRMVDEVLRRWGQDTLVDDVALCVTELSTNSALHGASNFQVEVDLLDDGISVSVLDDGNTPAEVIASRADTAGQQIDHTAEHAMEDPATTGRGLLIVATLASEWGIDDTDQGVRIWAVFRRRGFPAARTSPEDLVTEDLDSREQSHDRDQDQDHDDEDRAHQPQVTAHVPGPRAQDSAPGSYVTVLLLCCPADLLMTHDENLADIVREVQVMGAGELEPELRSVLEDISGIVQRNAVTWDAARLAAREAVRAGNIEVDITVLAPSRVGGEVARLRAAVDRAEDLSRRGGLMTLPVALPVQRLRDWLEHQLVGQVDHGQDPLAFPDWIAAQGTPLDG